MSPDNEYDDPSHNLDSEKELGSVKNRESESKIEFDNSDSDDSKLLEILGQCERMSQEEIQATADSLLMHGLLLHSNGTLQESTDRALQRTLSALNDGDDSTEEILPLELQSTPSTSSHDRVRWWQNNRVRMAVAASLLFILITFVWQSRLPSARSLLAQAFEYSLSNLDREYHIRLERGPIETEGTLIVRGNHSLRLQIQSIAGEQVFGRSGDEYWFAPPIGPVLKSDSRYWIASMLHQHSGELPYLEPATVIQRLQEGYSLKREFVDDPLTNRPSYRIIATSDVESSDIFQPERVTLWIDVESGRTVRIILQRHLEKRTEETGNPPIFQGLLTIEYRKESQLAEDFYRCESQYPDRTILSRQWSTETP